MFAPKEKIRGAMYQRLFYDQIDICSREAKHLDKSFYKESTKNVEFYPMKASNNYFAQSAGEFSFHNDLDVIWTQSKEKRRPYILKYDDEHVVVVWLSSSTDATLEVYSILDGSLVMNYTFVESSSAVKISNGRMAIVLTDGRHKLEKFVVFDLKRKTIIYDSLEDGNIEMTMKQLQLEKNRIVLTDFSSLSCKLQVISFWV